MIKVKPEFVMRTKIYRGKDRHNGWPGGKADKCGKESGICVEGNGSMGDVFGILLDVVLFGAGLISSLLYVGECGVCCGESHRSVFILLVEVERWEGELVEERG